MFPRTYPQVGTAGQYLYPYELFNYYLTNFWSSLAVFVANLVVALILVLFGFLVAFLLEYVVRWVVEKLRINEGLEHLGFNKWAEKANLQLALDKFLGRLTFWVVWLLFWMMAFDILGLSSFNQLLSTVLRFLPNALVAGLVIVASLFLADFLKKVFYAVLKGSDVRGAEFGSEVVYYSLVVFGLGVALYQLGVAREIIGLLVGGAVLAGALATGLAFGLGCQDVARDLVEKLRRKLS